MKRVLALVRSLRKQGANGVAVKLLWGAVDFSVSFEDKSEEESASAPELQSAIGFTVHPPLDE